MSSMFHLDVPEYKTGQTYPVVPNTQRESNLPIYPCPKCFNSKILH